MDKSEKEKWVSHDLLVIKGAEHMKFFGVNWMKKIIIMSVFFIMTNNALALCTDTVTISALAQSHRGYIHVLAKDADNNLIKDMDILNCGNNTAYGMMFDLKDTYDSSNVDGKKLLYSTLLYAYSSGEGVKLCARTCSSLHAIYSSLSNIMIGDFK